MSGSLFANKKKPTMKKSFGQDGVSEGLMEEFLSPYIEVSLFGEKITIELYYCHYYDDIAIQFSDINND